MVRHWAIVTALLLFVVTGVFSQITVRGTVEDKASGEPLIGASVLIKGTFNDK